MNENIVDFTYGEVSDHVNTIISNVENFAGVFPGSSNLRNLGLLAEYGTKFVQHTGPLSACNSLQIKNPNAVKSLDTLKKNMLNGKETLYK